MPAAVAAATTTATAGEEVKDGIQAMNTLKSTDPPLFLSPSEQLSNAARLASGYLFDSLKPYAPKSPFSHLLVNGFDAEQIWQQIDLQSQPLVSSLRRRVKKLENNPDELRAMFNLGGNGNKEGVKEERENGALFNLGENGKKEGVEEASEDEDDVRGFDDDEELEDIEDEDEEDEDDDGIDEEEEGGGGIEDRFLKKKEMKKYLDDEEDAWYGKKKKKGGKKSGDADDADDEEGGDEEGSSSDDDEMDNVEGDEDEDEDDELGLDDAEDDGSEDELGKARYDDFFGTTAKAGQKRKSKPLEVSNDLDMDEPSSNGTRSEKKQKLSTHEKEREKIRSTIEEMEKANLETKAWTMQGEVTAAKRPKNSALETDLDFDHNARPPPVITEEVTESLEEIIKKRILEANFDDVQKPQALPSKAPREVKELDENKSKKGLAEIYEEEYVQKSGLVSTSMSFSDQQKKEAANLFKELCVKLDALSHFHFTPKPVIEDMSVQANVPALAMEEIAPLAVSDAAMLAPEEVFSGKGDIKEEKELTQAERKRRRAKKKRKFKAVTAKKNFSKAQRQQTLSTDKVEGNEES